MLDWNALGDGSVFDPMPAQGKQIPDVWANPASVRAGYADTVEDSLTALFSGLQKYGDNHTVLVVLGDHQPRGPI